MNDNLAYELEFCDELIDGEIVLMSPRPATNHNQTAFNIAALFKTFLKGKTCRVFPDGMDLYLTEKDRFVPDVMVICDRSKIKNDGIHGAPDLVVEVLSPSSIKRDRVYKKRIYEQCGVREYWIVNPRNKTVLVDDFDKTKRRQEYSFGEDVPVCIYEGFTLNIEKMLEETN